MMRHSARPIETNIVIEESLNDDDDECYPTPTIRRHRPVTALVRRRSSKLEKLVQSVAKEGDFDMVNDHDRDRMPMPTVGMRAASAPHRMSITSFYADSASSQYQPDKHEPQSQANVRRNSTKEDERRPSIRPRSTVTLERPPLIPRRQRTKSAIQLRRESAPPKSKSNDVGDCGSDDEEKSNSDSDADSDSSLSTLESLRELKSRIDEIVGTRSVNASRTVRRGSVTNPMNMTRKKKAEEKSEMVADYVIRRRPSLISVERQSRSVMNLKERRNLQQRESKPATNNHIRGRSASLATTSALASRSRSARVTTASRQRTKSVTTIDGTPSPGLQMFENRRASIATTFKDARGTMSYQARKNLRRGSLFVDSKVVEEEDDNRRGSLLPPEHILPGHRGSFEGMKRSTMSRRRAPLPEDLNIAVPDQMSVKLARERFRRISRLVLNCVKICRRSHLNIEEERAEFQSFIQVGTRSHGDRLFFDPDYFKADQSQRLSEETKRILTEHPHKRTERDLKYVQIALRNIKAFAEYPIRMQGRLCKAGWLETYGANRAVLRQGHPPHAFYFILSGTLIVTIFMMHGPKGKPATQTVAFLRRGQSFGELAILNEAVRASTVITKSRCELLVISVEDFQDIFMVSGGIKSVNDPDQHAFLTSLRFLTHWPIHIIPTHPKDCLFHFFATGDVLVQDSNQSDWIYIIKSGSCSVLKKLKSVAENVHSSYKRKDVCMTWNKDTTLVTSIMPDRNKSPNRKKIKKNNNKMDTPSSETSRRSSATASSGVSIKVYGSETSSIIPPVIRLKSQGLYLKTGSVGENIYSTVDDDSGSDEEKEELGEDGLPVNFVNQRRTFHTDLDVAKKTNDQTTDADKDPMFVTIQLLLKGGVFGVNNIVFPDQPSLSLVSNGAECIMIRKSFYLEHATEDTLSLLRKNEFPYPTEEQLQEKLQKHMNWNAFKDHTVKSVVFQSRAHKAQQLTSGNR